MKIPYFVWFHKVTPTPSPYTVGWRGWRMTTRFFHVGRPKNPSFCSECGMPDDARIRSVSRPIFAPNVVRSERR